MSAPATARRYRHSTRVLVVSDTLPPDPNGVALLALRTAQKLSTQADVHLIGPEGPAKLNGVRVTGFPRSSRILYGVRCPSWKAGVIGAAVRHADRVVVHSLGPLGLIALHFCRRFGRHATLFIHNDHPTMIRQYLPPTAFVTTPLSGMAWIAERWAVKQADLVLVPPMRRWNGHPQVHLSPPAFHGPRKTPAGKGVITVGYHGRVSREKAVDVIVRALAQVDRGRGACQLRVIGEGTHLDGVLALARALGVVAMVVPWCEEPRAWLSDVDVYVTPSRTETYSISTLEALGCGLPVISRRVGAIPSYVEDGVNGLLFDNDDELPGLIERLVRDPALRQRLGRAAQERAVSESIWDQFADASWSAHDARLDPLLRS